MQKTWGSEEKFIPQLPNYYEIDDTRKPCLTYIMQIIHVDIDRILEKNYDRNAIALILLAVPNGLLYKEYGENIMEEPKSYHKRKGKRYRPANFRYAYYRYPSFGVLKKKGTQEYRVRVVFNKRYSGEKFLTTWKYNKRRTVVMLPKEVTQLSEDVVQKLTTVFKKKDSKIIVTKLQGL